MQGPPTFINFDSNAEEEGNKIVRFFNKAKDSATSLGTAASQALGKLAKSTKDSSDAIESQEESMRKAAKSANDLIKAYFGLEKFNDSTGGGTVSKLPGNDYLTLLKQAKNMESKGVQPDFNPSGSVAIVDKRSADNAKFVREQLSYTKDSAKEVAKSTGEMGDDLDKAASKDAPALRYTLYDVANTATRIGTILAAAVVAPAIASIKFEREFANVASLPEKSFKTLKTT